ncbi:MAG: methyltransferase [Sphingomonas sp. 28-62-20]|uniref:class I SAM-dependent methyltransferase n=1 Tax=Sphingomonas sp. 28-62-20 TaxID=1970433 RepID=UPI000BC722D7|nr:MAG: methyltransferase [Sphingomonas sp. 28-62-20]
MKALKAIAPIALVALATVAIAHDGKHPASPAQVAAALAAPGRADQAGDDARRHAAEVIAFTGAGPGSTVIDFLPGQGYWTRILSGVVGPTGHVYALWPAGGAKYAEKPLPALRALGLANMTAEVLPTNRVAAPTPVDIVLTVQNYHDIPNKGVGEAGIDLLNKGVFDALKPGGTYVVIDHADAPETGLSGTETKHRIDPAAVKAEVLKAGFVLAGESNALANSEDDHSKNVFDPAVRGHTDQFMLKFRKPLQ